MKMTGSVSFAVVFTDYDGYKAIEAVTSTRGDAERIAGHYDHLRVVELSEPFWPIEVDIKDE